MSSFNPVAFELFVELVSSILGIRRLTALLVESATFARFAAETLLLALLSAFLSISLTASLLGATVATFLAQNDLLLAALVLALVVTALSQVDNDLFLTSIVAFNLLFDDLRLVASLDFQFVAASLASLPITTRLLVIRIIPENTGSQS